MTISSTNRKAGPYAGNDVAVAFPFAFKVFSAADLYVVRADSLGAEADLVLTTDYTVVLNADQNANPGGTITLLAALATGYTLTITSNVEYLQPTDLTNQGGFYPKVITNALDRLTIFIQQLAEAVSRSLKTAISTPPGVTSTLPAPVPYALIGWNSAGDGFRNVPPLDSAGTAFTQTGIGAVPRSVSEKLSESVSAADFGAMADGATDDATAIQKAINAVALRGGGFVDLEAGTHIIGTTLVLASKVILRGQGSSSTILKAKSGLNATVIKSTNYDALVGTDTWLVASGNQYAYGLVRLKIDGNKANQASGSGVQFYGKRLHIDDVIITSCKEEGWHSESNQTIPGAPDTSGDDFPESLIRGLYIWQCDSHGFVFRGQHDTYIESLFVGVCGGWGVRFESDTTAPGVYSGTCDSGFMHVYANVAGGIYINQYASHQSAFMISENNDGVGLQVDGWQVKVGQLQLYSNCRVTGTYQAVISGSECKFPSVHLKDTGHSKSGIQITGTKNTVDVTAIGGGSTGCAVDVNSSYNHVRATIDNWSGAGGIGLRTGNTSQLQHGKIIATINACSTCWNNASVGTWNDYTISGFAAAGKSFFSGSSPNTSKTENWNVKGITNGVTTVLSENRVRSLNAIDLNSTTEQEITVAHGLVVAPLIQDVVPVLSYLNSNLTWVQSRLYVRSVDATNVKIRFKASTAAGGADVADLFVNVKL